MFQLARDVLSDSDIFLKLLATLGGLLVFLVGLYQYSQAELWKRKEFLGNEMKAFFADQSTRNMLMMIDWYERKIPFFPDTDRNSWPRVSRPILVTALEPHTLPSAGRELEITWCRTFNDLEALIRDCHDKFFDSLERIDSFATVGLYRREELRPFLEYWMRSVARQGGPSFDRRWRLALLAYIQFYGFEGTQRLFKAIINVDISVGGEVWKRLTNADEALATKLEAACTRGLEN